ncbi:MAG: hypothetical protein WCB95_10735, partial [Aeromicrobium sp.]
VPPDRSLPPYPPLRVWSFPPPPVGRRWFWVALVGAVVSALVGSALVVTAIVLESRDAPGVIDSTTVLSTIEDGCDLMTSDVDSTSMGSSPERITAAIREQNEFVEAMLQKVEALPKRVLAEDRPTTAWLTDWRRLVSARETYAKSLVDEGPQIRGFTIPRNPDGEPITRRMEEALLNPVCDIPTVLLDPGQRTMSST